MTADPDLVSELFERAVADFGDSPALIEGDRTWSFSSLRADVARARSVLSAAGVRKGTTVATMFASSSDTLISFLATMGLGARWTGVNPSLPLEHRVNLLAHCRARCVLAESGAHTDLAEVPTVRALLERDRWRDELERSEPRPLTRDVDPFSAAAVAYTSGTSGAPKGVVHSQHNIGLPGRYLATTPDFGPGTVIGVCLPMTSLNVIAVSVLPALFAGRPCVVAPKARADSVAEATREQGITTMSMPPPVIFDLATRADIDPGWLATMWAPRTGGAGLDAATMAAYEARHGRRVMRTYGLSEVPTVVALEPRGEVLGPRASGRVVPYLDVSIVDAHGQPCAPGTAGEICISAATHGPYAHAWRPMLGYLRRPRATAKAVQNGLLRTGDRGRVDDDGVLVVEGRLNRMINRGGANIYPDDIEAVLRSLESVVDAAVVGIPDRRLGERVAAAVVAADPGGVDLEVLGSACRTQLARYQVPEVIVLVEELPRNAMGKVVPAAVRELIDRSRA